MTARQSWREEQFGPYRVFECLGIGGMASVHRALHVETGREVALKRLLPQLADDRKLVAQFRRESRIAGSLEHRNIVGLFDAGAVEGVQYLSMELIRGTSLLELLRRAHRFRTPTPVGVALAVLRQLLDALDYVANATDEYGDPLNVVHRDISPSNLILEEDGTVKIIDFGVAKALSGRYATDSGRIKGKLGYMSPEALAGRPLDGRADLFSVAVVVWELLTARRLYKGNDRAQLKQRREHRERIPASTFNGAVPGELDDLIAIALDVDPNGRWPSAAAMRVGLQTLIDHFGNESSRLAIEAWMAGLEARITLTGPRGIVLPTEAIDLEGCLAHDYGLDDVADRLHCTCPPERVAAEESSQEDPGDTVDCQDVWSLAGAPSTSHLSP